MDLTTRIFFNLAEIAKWAFDATLAEPGTYTLTEILRDKTYAFFILTEKLDFSTLPGCAERVNENEDILRLTYNDGKNVYQFRARDVFGMLNRFKRIADEVKASEKASCCTFTREEDEGELIAIYDMPKTKTKALVKAVANDTVRPVMNGVYLDKDGYAVASEGHILSVISVCCDVTESYNGAIIPAKAAKRADGKCIEIYKRADGSLYAVTDGELFDCIGGRYPNWRGALPKIPVSNGIRIKSRDLLKTLPKKTELVNLSWNAGTLNVSYTDSEGGDAAKGLQADGVPFSGIYKLDVIKRIVPGCCMMYPIGSARPTVFIGDGLASVIMPWYKEDGGVEQYDNYSGEMVGLLEAMDPAVLAAKEEETQTAEAAATPANDESTQPAAVNADGQTETVQTDEKTEKGESLELCRARMLAYYMTDSIIRLNDRAGEPQHLAATKTAVSQNVQTRHSITGVLYAFFLPLRAQNAISRVFVPITRKNLVRAKYHGKLPYDTRNVSCHLARGPTHKAA